MRELRALCVLAQLAVALAQIYTTSNVIKESRAPSIKNRKMDFVRNIREDLRRDNDDYSAAVERQDGSPAYQKLHQPLNQIPKPKSNAQPSNLPESKSGKVWDGRRAQNLSMFAPPLPPPPGSGSQGAQATDNDTVRFRAEADESADMLEGDVRRGGYKKVHVDKLKRLIHKGKLRLRDLNRNSGVKPIRQGRFGDGDTTPLSQKLEDILGSTLTTLDRHHRPHHATYAYHVDKRPRPPAISSEMEGGAMREHAGPAHGKSPSPDQLDMAPGRGSHVHIMRLKGVLCQRNVLLPEGPVYNRRGSTIMPAHKPELAHGREFPETRAPQLVLPKCCNCCKKSVLGCQ